MNDERKQYFKSYIYDEYIALIMFLWGGVQGYSYILSGKSITIMLVEELLFLCCIILREKQIYQFNCLIQNGKLIYADYDSGFYSSYERKGITGYVLHFTCTAEGKRFNGRDDIASADEGYKNSLMETLKTHKIPVIVDEQGKYEILFKGIVLDYMYFDRRKIEKNNRNKIVLIMLSRYAMFILIPFLHENTTSLWE